MVNSGRETIEERLKNSFYLFLTAFLFLLPGVALAVDVKINWKYQNFPSKIELYEVADAKRNSISTTGSYPLAEKPGEAVFTNKWKTNAFELKPGDSRPFVLVITNKSDKDLYFFATPHVVHPEKATLGHHFECLCNHTVFHVPAKSRWYRVVRLQVWPEYKHPKLTLLHHIVGVSAEDANTKFKNRIFLQ